MSPDPESPPLAQSLVDLETRVQALERQVAALQDRKSVV